MAKKTTTVVLAHKATHKRTSLGNGKVKTSSMNKDRRRGFKPYRGQGKI